MAEHVEFCSFREYVDNSAYRLDEEELSIGGLYTLMASYIKGTEHEAARVPAKLIEVGSSVSLFYVRFAALDQDLKKALRIGAFVADGYVSPMAGRILLCGETVAEAYFCDSELSTDWIELDLASSLDVVVSH